MSGDDPTEDISLTGIEGFFFFRKGLHNKHGNE
jgi:hypothetical protein